MKENHREILVVLNAIGSLMVQIMQIYKNIGKIGENKMKYNDFTSGEYVKKEDVMTYLRVFDWTMPREELIEKFKGISSITLSDQDINKVKINKVLNGEWSND